ncbi:MAG: SusC/RagA family TonB-linked outer membrane protein [Flavobacteriaceae bacterium]
MLKRIVNVFFLLLLSTGVYAQQVTVKGVVTDTADIPIADVNVKVKGTNTGTVTDFDGKYTIKAKNGDTLVFSNVSFESKEIVVSGSNHNVSLAEGNMLDEIVVTAFGIKKKERELGYSVTQVKAKDLNLVGQANAFEALQGQVAGLQVSRSSGSSGGGVDLLIRGVTSIDPSRGNQPLIIIDGLAMNNETYSGNVLPSEGSNSPNSAEQFSFTNRASDINPEDVESYSVLKGAAATALYGIRAANGAIIITTKKGKLGKAKFTINSSTSFSNVNKTPTLQKLYREGWSGRVETLYSPETASGFTPVFNSVPFHTWGPLYSDDSVENPGGDIIDLSRDQFYDPYDLFKTGVNTNINFSVSGATDKIDYLFSVGNNSSDGIMPNTEYNKTNFRFKSGYKITDKFTVNTSVSYAKSGGARANGGDKSVMSALSYFSSSFPVNDYQNADGTQRNFTPWIDNPRYFLEKSVLTDDVNRWIGNATFVWQPKEWLNVTYAAQIDNYSDQRNRFVPPELDTGITVGGFIVNQDINFTGLESNLLVGFTKDINDKIGTSFTVGHQVSDSKRDAGYSRGETLNVPGINDMANTINKFTGENVRHLRNVGLFGEFKMDYDNKLFLTLTGRNDWVSTLAKDKRSFFYPSINLAYDITDLLGDNDIMTFGKLRTSWAEVGKGPVFGRTGRFFIADGDFPFGGTGGYRYSTIQGDANTIPEKNQSFEIGTDLRFFKNRLRLDYSYYTTKANDQIFGVSTAPSSGISSLNRNAGDFETKGHEFLISGDIIKNEDFKWTSSINYSTSEGVVVKLPSDIESVVFVSSGFAGVTSEVKEGDKMGTLYGWKWRYENGKRYIGSDGKPRVDFDAGRQIVGNAFPDFIASLGNRMNYKGIGLNFLMEWKKGGDLYDSGRRNMIRNGSLGITEFRNVDTVLEGVMDDPANAGEFIANDQVVTIDQNYYRSSTRYNRASEILIQDASWLKLRNVGLSYNFNNKVLDLFRMNSLVASANVHNVLLWTPFDGFDPEGNQYSAGSNVYGFTGLSTPISESYSVGLKIGF